MSKTVLIIIISVAVLFMGMMGAGFFILWNKISQVPVDPSKVAEMSVEEEENVIGPLYPLNTMIVNLSDDGGKRYLRVTMALELSDPESVDTIESRLPQIRDAVLMILPTKTYDDVSTTDGKIALRNQIMEKINTLMTKGRVNNIYFTEFVVQ
ncbi:flagellar basal body-associated protein FliL [Desulfosarcina sp.]|uniref:flagellar basal body-associated FliL family protein n=1 Tax=Desulfosarcina sp. TaxID=2027861 RepID=UPI0029AD4B83|nr:flagellar basal body-associated FliL family protein [Desulfosarcina sp.]MDX2455002.1 flagellar basal body-associated FliL family protein [Desulfosarcina sp.]MDX2492577.1 flagellar basal body-associated FliL family protein [Desulfosarcina sp.]